MTEQIKALIAVVLFALGLSVGWVMQGWRKDAALAVQEKAMSTLREQAARQLSEATTQARKAGEALQAAADQQRKTDNEEKHALSTRADAFARRVRDAEARAATARLVSEGVAASAGQAARRCDQPVVLGALGEPDVWEAERADKLRVALKSCYASYDKARAQAAE